MENILGYDPDVYDKHSYQREIIREKMNLKDYDNLLMPVRTQFVDDLDGGDTSYSVSRTKLFSQFYELLSTYYKYPHPHIEFIKSDVLNDLLLKQYIDLCEACKEEPEIKQLIYFIPILQYVHYPTKWDDSSYLHLATYANIIESGSAIISDDKYVVYKIPLSAGVDINICDYLFERTDEIFGDDLSKIRDIKFMSLESALNELVSSCDLF